MKFPCLKSFTIDLHMKTPLELGLLDSHRFFVILMMGRKCLRLGCFTLGKFLLIYIYNFHVLSNLLLIYICKLHWNLNTMFVCQVNPL